MNNITPLESHRPKPPAPDWPSISVRLRSTSADTPGYGYWKARARYDLAERADTWRLFVEDAPFFLSSMTWYHVLWTPPGDNAYFTLARQYIAARLNMLTGASTPPDVAAALAWADIFFVTHTPTSRLGDAVREHVILNAGRLDRYNMACIDTVPR